jgi:hypothetical protein
METKKFALATSIALALAATLAVSANARYELLLSGPVESVDRMGNAITVLGHRLTVRDVSAMALGHKVNVFGLIALGGSVSAKLVQNTSAYAASGDQVLIVGRVNAVDQSRGRLIIDGATVDYTALLARPGSAVPAVGDTVRVLGTQPLGRGVVLALEMAAHNGVSGSSGALGVSGSSSALGVSGSSSALGVSGSSSALGVSGSSSALGVSGSSSALGVSGGRSKATSVSDGNTTL